MQSCRYLKRTELGAELQMTQEKLTAEETERRSATASLLEQLNSALQDKVNLEEQQRSAIESRDKLQAALDVLTDDLVRQEMTPEGDSVPGHERLDAISNEAKVRIRNGVETPVFDGS